MKWKVPLAIVIVVILVSMLVVYYLEFGPGSSSSWGNPSLVYDFNSTITFDQSGHNLGGSFLGWNASGYVRNNETDAVTIHYPGSLSRQFMALSSKVNVGFDWTLNVMMVVSRRLNGVYSDVTYSNESVNDLPYTNAYAFDADNGTAFTVRFEASAHSTTYLFRVKLWNSAEVP